MKRGEVVQWDGGGGGGWGGWGGWVGGGWVRCFFFSSRRRHTRLVRDWSSDVCSSDLALAILVWLALSPEFFADKTPGDFVAFLGAAGLLAKPIRQLSQINSVIQRGLSAAYRDRKSVV